VSRQARQPHDPLRGTWRAGQEPAPEPTPAPQQEDERSYSIYDPDYLAQLRAVQMVRRAYGLSRNDFKRWGQQHDRAALKLYRMMRNGEELPATFTQQPRAVPPINPDDWLTPRQRSS
jgi:hypothetical protein